MFEPETKFVPHVSSTQVGATTGVATEEEYDVSAIVPENCIAVVVFGRYDMRTNSMTIDTYGKSGETDPEAVQRITAHAGAGAEPDMQHVTHIIPLDAAKKFYSLKSGVGLANDLIMSWVGWIELIQPKVQ